MSPEEGVKEGGELSIEERVAQLEQAFSSFDGKALAEKANNFSLMMMAAHGESPGLAAEAFPAIEAALTDIDFGKMREAVIATLDYGVAVATKSLEKATDNPVIIANLVGMLPAVANSLVRIVSTILQNTDLPPEILASALFNVLTALDAEELGRTLSTLSEQIQELHAGSMILGGDEPRLRAVFTDFMKRVLDSLDVEAATGAAIALGEDTEVIAGALAELAARDPKTALALTRMAASLGNSMTRTCSAALGEAAAWPDELLVKMGELYRESSDAVEVGRAVDSFVTLSLRFREANPDLYRDMLIDTLRAVNTEQLELVLRGAANDVKQAALANPGIRMTLQPEEVGRRINGMLAGFNRATGQAAVKDYLSRLSSVIDSREVEAAVRNLGGGVVKAVFASPLTAKSLMKAAASSAWKLIKNMAGLLTKR